MGTFTQVQDGLKESTGVDVQALLAGFLGGDLAAKAVKKRRTWLRHVAETPVMMDTTTYQEVVPSDMPITKSDSECEALGDLDETSDCPYAE